MTNPIILYDNKIEDATTITVTSEASGFEKENAYDELTHDFWKPTGAGTVYYTMDFGSAIDIDAWGVAAHNLGTNGASIQLQYSASGAWAGEEVNFGSAISPSGTEPRLQTGTSQNKRYWRFKIVSASAASSIGALLLGEHLEMASGLRPANKADHLAQRYEAELNVSEAAALLGTSVKKNLVNGRMVFDTLTRAWVRTNWQPFKEHVELGKSFLYQPDQTFYPAEVTFGWLSGKIPDPQHQGGLHMSVQLRYAGIVD